MRIGFAGAHRTGKSTLAKAVAGLYDVPFLTSRASNVAAEYNFDMAQDNRLTTNGMAMQESQLDTMIRQLESQDSYVCDRTPIDAAAYLLADANAMSGSPAMQEDAVVYIEHAMRQTAARFDIVILVPPALTFEPKPGKPPMNPAYQEHLHMLVRGMLFDDEIEIAKGQIQRTNTEHNNRLRAAIKFIEANRASFARAA